MTRLASLAVAAMLTRSAELTRTPETHVVHIARFAFAPQEVQAVLGDTIEWLNDDVFVHTSAADSAAWSSPELAPGKRFLLVAERLGRFQYHCAAHPVMHGVLIVR